MYMDGLRFFCDFQSWWIHYFQTTDNLLAGYFWRSAFSFLGFHSRKRATLKYDSLQQKLVPSASFQECIAECRHKKAVLIQAMCMQLLTGCLHHNHIRPSSSWLADIHGPHSPFFPGRCSRSGRNLSVDLLNIIWGWKRLLPKGTAYEARIGDIRRRICTSLVSYFPWYISALFVFIPICVLSSSRVSHSMSPPVMSKKTLILCLLWSIDARWVSSVILCFQYIIPSSIVVL